MSDPRVELQAAIRAALKADVGLQALFGAGKPVKVYDIPPTNTAKPYLVIGEDSLASDAAECIDGAEVSATVHAWSLTSPPALAEAKALSAAAQGVLLALEGTLLPSHRIVTAALELARCLPDTDGVTAHAVLTIRFNTEPL